jgi:hypothetical protein
MVRDAVPHYAEDGATERGGWETPRRLYGEEGTRPEARLEARPADAKQAPIAVKAMYALPRHLDEFG